MTSISKDNNTLEYHVKKCTLLLIFSLILVIGLFLSLALGAVKLPFSEILRVIFLEHEGKNHLIIADVRLPRTLIAALVGMNLAVAGVIMQGITRNPMASPGILGVSNGAGLVTLIMFVIFPNSFRFIPIASFIGAFATTALIYSLAYKNGISPVRFILSGVAVSTLLGAAYDIIINIFPDAISGMVGFMVGSLSARTWEHFYLILPYTIVGIIISLFFTTKLNILMMGEEIAMGLGVNVEKTRIILIIISSLLAGSAVSVVGRLGFVGLCVPHITRMLIGTDYRYLLPATAINGAATLVICDTISRIILDPKEIPVGIIMAVIGAPFFLYLLREQKR